MLTFTLTNFSGLPDLFTLTGVGFSDFLPAGVAVGPIPNVANTCGGTLTGFTPGSTVITLAGGTIDGAGTCAISVLVVGNTAGPKNNVTAPVMSTEGGIGNTASAQLYVGTLPPVLTKTFGAIGLGLNSTTTLTFSMANLNNDKTLTQVAFTDPFPSGLQLASPAGVAGTCDPDTITAAAGGSSVAVTNAVLLPSASCSFTVNVKGVVPGLAINTTSALVSAEAPPGDPAAANIMIGNRIRLLMPPIWTKANLLSP